MNEPTQTYRLGAHTRRSDGGRLIVGGAPPRCLRLSAAGAGALDAVLLGRPEPRAVKLVERLVSYGVLDPVAGRGRAEVTFVIPVRDGGPALADLVAALKPFGPVVVVDDGSRDGSPALARRAGARVVANDGPAGPAGARNAGWRLARTDHVAFIDADCGADGDWARPLAALLAADPGLALVAPRVRGNQGPGRLARWERLSSPLDMGGAGGLVGPGRRIPYVPSAALVARRDALAALGGFDERLRFGEDVDLVWRAVAAGWSVRYAAEIEVRHLPRPTLRARARQHFHYGTSAAALEARHPGSAAPLLLGRDVLPAALLAAGSPRGALLAAAALGLKVASGRDDPQSRRAVGRLALDAQLSVGRDLARALARDWLPPTLLATTRRGRLRRAALSAVAADVLAATWRDPTAAPVNAFLRLADNAAYCAGLWSGGLSAPCPRVLVPRLRRRTPPPTPSTA